MKKIDLENVQEAADFKKVTPGGYICKITAVNDDPEKEYLKIEYDVADGEFKGHFQNLYISCGFWGGSFIKSYKEKALPFFKGFITAVESSNRGYKWNNDETSLVDKYVGLVLGEEEYTKKDGTVGERIYVHQIRSVEAIKKKDFSIPPKKRVNTGGTTNARAAIDILVDDDDVVF